MLKTRYKSLQPARSFPHLTITRLLKQSENRRCLDAWPSGRAVSDKICRHQRHGWRHVENPQGHLKIITNFCMSKHCFEKRTIIKLWSTSNDEGGIKLLTSPIFFTSHLSDSCDWLQNFTMKSNVLGAPLNQKQGPRLDHGPRVVTPPLIISKIAASTVMSKLSV